MDEILIEQKKYVSSKQAAKLTGYAKDYVGQLCREGRVPARLVGRGWYVLESAIQDHRFGNEDVAAPVVAEPEPAKEPEPWKFPRYEADRAEVLPSLNRLRDPEPVSEPVASADEHEMGVISPQELTESWKEWFDQVAPAAEPQDAPVTPAYEPSVVVVSEQPEPIPEPEIAEEPAHIPLHVIDEAREEEYAPRVAALRAKKRAYGLSIFARAHSLPSRLMLSVQVVGVFVAVTFVVLAFLGSGYFDSYIVSSNRASFLSGVIMFDR